jgi:hypothetical protein
MGPADKARRVRIPPVFERGATPSAGDAALVECSGTCTTGYVQAEERDAERAVLEQQQEVLGTSSN